MVSKNKVNVRFQTKTATLYEQECTLVLAQWCFCLFQNAIAFHIGMIMIVLLFLSFCFCIVFSSPE